MTDAAVDHVPGEGPAKRAPLFLAPDRMAASPGYIPSLDGLRSVSILLVLLAHYVSARLFPGGLGVYVFFVISGFLISRLIFAEWKRTGALDFKGFYIRRALRLYPVVILFTIVVIAFYIATARPVDWVQPASALLYFANYLYAARTVVAPVTGEMPFGIFWSLSIEEHFYLLFPLAFVLLKGRPGALVWAMIAVCVGCLALRLIMAVARPDLLSTLYFYLRSEFRLDSIAFGVMLSALCETQRGRVLLQRFTGLAAAGLAVVVLVGTLAIRDPFFRETLRYSLQGAAIMVLVASVLFSPRLAIAQRVLNTTPMVFIGRLSYSLYVWHTLVPIMLMPTFGLKLNPVTSAILTVTALVLALISYHLVEKPALRLRHRFGSRARAAD